MGYAGTMKRISYARHRFPPDVIRHAVWLYLRFTLSYRDVEDCRRKEDWKSAMNPSVDGF
jgi:transposase-like protein